MSMPTSSDAYLPGTAASTTLWAAISEPCRVGFRARLRPARAGGVDLCRRVRQPHQFHADEGGADRAAAGQRSTAACLYGGVLRRPACVWVAGHGRSVTRGLARGCACGTRYGRSGGTEPTIV
jgi:hypothetical protein